MYKIEYIGSWKSIPEAAAAIYDSDIPKLEAMLQNGLNLSYSAYCRSLLQAGCGDALCETSCKAQFR